MDTSPQQDRALVAVSDWLRGSDQVFYLAGFAGTGKTTLAKIFANDVVGEVLFGAFTGKAAHVLQRKGCPGARTIHSLIYTSQTKSKVRLEELRAQLQVRHLKLLGESDRGSQAVISEDKQMVELLASVRREEEALEKPSFAINWESDVTGSALLVIDECSMVDQQMGEDLCKLAKKILVLGDPGQLPPIHGTGYFTSREPDLMLTEIHRQARDNPIIEMSRRIREGDTLHLGCYGSSKVVSKAEANETMALDADQILVGRNDTRRATNRRFRLLLDHQGPYPVAGDRLVCLRNNHDRGFLNGSMWDTLGADEVTEEDKLVDMIIQPHMDVGQPRTVRVWKDRFHIRPRKMPWWDRIAADEFTYGYALTVHKAQGSQWDNVLLFDEWHNRNTRRQWLYTAVTRAAERVTVVTM